MLNKILSFFTGKCKQVRKIAFLDGDQPLAGILAAHHTHLQGVETHLVRLKPDSAGEPHLLRKRTDINKIYLSGYTTKKEVTDKFIGAYIQKAVQDGYDDITVVSSDYDFIDIFKMSVVLNPAASKITFRIIIPNARGRLCELPEKIMNIEIVHC
jgi:hypothetical protein